MPRRTAPPTRRSTPSSTACGPTVPVVKGLATLRAAYAAVGLGWVLRPTALAPVRPVFDLAYRLFARYRRPISRAAAPLIDTVRARRTLARLERCRGGACDITREDRS